MEEMAAEMEKARRQRVLKDGITEAIDGIDRSRMQMRGASKLCVAFGNLQDEESWMVANRVIKDCELTIASARAALERVKLEVYGNDAAAKPQRANG